MADVAVRKLEEHELKIQHLELEAKSCRTENLMLKKREAHFLEQIADLKQELCGLETESNIIIFSSKHSTVSPSETSTEQGSIEHSKYTETQGCPETI